MPPVRTNTSSKQQKFAYPSGEWILRSYAQKQFPVRPSYDSGSTGTHPLLSTPQLAPKDLDSILPISREPNPRGGKYPIVKYNLRDVRALAARLAPKFGPDERAEKDGAEIQAAAARKRFNVSDVVLGYIARINSNTTTAMSESYSCINVN